jgi:hypothetical protein
MMTLTDKEEKNFKKFRTELTKISKQYGIAIKSIGGVMIGEIADIEYSEDSTSGDLYPTNIEWIE